nr:MAG TPA: hypothetical protein [Caudoviricetes sp.]
MDFSIISEKKFFGCYHIHEDFFRGTEKNSGITEHNDN